MPVASSARPEPPECSCRSMLGPLEGFFLFDLDPFNGSFRLVSRGHSDQFKGSFRPVSRGQSDQCQGVIQTSVKGQL